MPSQFNLYDQNIDLSAIKDYCQERGRVRDYAKDEIFVQQGFVWKYGEDFVNRTPQETLVYVPIGSAELYRNAWGWNYFTNFIETDKFPSSSIYSVVIDGKEDNGDYYDLLGRKVEAPTPGTIYIHNGKKYIYK